MKVYLVGGAVRDKLLGLPVNEKDWVVVGATPEEMVAKGFKPIGKEFPVFLHPETHEEYALARTERKIARGYKGFVFYSAPTVSLEEDLKRRDLTINAIAETSEGQLIDPYGGQQDLKNKIMRHVSSAFQEDPVRILRIARFATQFPQFSIHPDTLHLMKEMVYNGEVNALVPERVWQEFVRALNNKSPTRFFNILNDCHALSILFPEIQIGSKGIDTLSQIVDKTPYDPILRFAVLLHDLSPEKIQGIINRYPVPNDYTELALLVSRFKSTYTKISSIDEHALLDFVIHTDALRRPQRFDQFLFICELTAPNITPQDHQKIKDVIHTIKTVDIKPLQKQGLKGEPFAQALREKRLSAIRRIISN